MILKILEDNKESLGEKYEIIINEFLAFAKHYKLGRLISMNNEEMKRFIENFAELEKFRKPCTDKLLDTIEKLRDEIIINGQEYIEQQNDNDANHDKLPCLYKCLKIKDWHDEFSAYIYINILQKKPIGVCLTGYENDKNSRNKFLKLWTDNMKDKYQKDLKLKSFTWVNDGEDELAINGGYFKEVEVTTGKPFIPTDTEIFSRYFYFGYNYESDIPISEALVKTIADDFKALLESLAVV